MYLRLQSSHDLLASLHHRVQFASDHDGQALVFSQRQLDVSPRPLHDVQTHFGLLALPELAVVLVATLLQGHMKYLHVQTNAEERAQISSNALFCSHQLGSGHVFMILKPHPLKCMR